MVFVTTLLSVGLMVALCLPGFILRKVKWLKDAVVPGLVVLLLYVAQPALTVQSFLEKDYESGMLINMGAALLLSIVLHLLLFFVGKASLLGIRDLRERHMLENSTFLGNVGYMGIPVMKALFPDSPEMLLYTAIFIVGFNMVGWTLGVYNITGNRKDISLRRLILNPPVLALLAVLPVFFTKSYIPAEVITKITPFIDVLAGMTLPLSMTILGIRLADQPFKSLFVHAGTYIATALKLIAAPLISFGLMLILRQFVPLDPMLFVTGFIVMALPSASLVLSLAEKFGGDRETAVRVNVFTTLLCILTIPLMMLLADFLL